MGPVGFEPTTKGFTLSPAFPPGVDYLFTRAGTLRYAAPQRVGAGCSCLSLRALEPPGSLCTFRRCTGGSAQDCHERGALEGFPEFIPSTSRVSARRHHLLMSPLH